MNMDFQVHGVSSSVCGKGRFGSNIVYLCCILVSKVREPVKHQYKKVRR
jgi:hypothetical protein